jgi:hypothetical protein
MYAVQLIELLKAAHIFGQSLTLPRDAPFSGVLVYPGDASGNQFSQILWTTAQVGSGSGDLRDIDSQLPSHSN